LEENLIALRDATLQYGEPMPESQDLCLERGSIPEPLSNRVEQREDDREHGIRKL
jgi:hypothetical protein